MFTLALIWAAIGYLLLVVGATVGLPPRGFLSWSFIALIVSTIVLLIRQGIFFSCESWFKNLWKSGIIGKALFVIFLSQLALNFVGAFAPELSFDALWYHLTLPKLYLEWGRIDFRPGNLLPWGVPRLGEMWYLLTLALDQTGTAAKFLHLFAGLISFALIIKLSRSTLFALVWYTMLSVGWLSTTAYVDLFAVLYLLLGVDELLSNKNKFLAGLFFGLVASFKIVFFLPGLILAIALGGPAFLVGLLLPVLPWVSISFVKTGDLLYPLGTYQINDIAAPAIQFFARLIKVGFAPWNWTFHPDTPISPVYLALLPLSVLVWRRLSPSARKILKIGLAVCFVCWFFPEFSNRYLLPGLAILATSIPFVIQQLNKVQQRIVITFTLATIVLSLSSRTVATMKFVPYILKLQSKEEFLLKNLNFSFGDFYDQGGQLAQITKGQIVLIDGYHNLFYVDFPFDHLTWSKSTQDYPYILSSEKNAYRYAKLPIVYRNATTKAILFANSPNP